MRRIRLVLAAALAAVASACQSDATGPADPRLTGRWSAGIPVSVSSGASVQGAYVYTLVIDAKGGYQWEAAAFDRRAPRFGPVSFVRTTGTVEQEGATLRFRPSVTVERNANGGGLPPGLLAGPGAEAVSFDLTGGSLHLRLSQPGDRDAGKVIPFNRRAAL